MKRTLQIDNNELSALYEELAATDETLRDQYDVLETSQQKLQLSEERYRFVIDATNDAIWDFDIVNKTTYFSDKWYSMLGYSKSYFDDNDINWISIVHPDDIRLLPDISKCDSDNQINFCEFEFRLKASDGSYKWIHSKGKMFYRADGSPYRMTGSHSDITNLKEAQNLLTYSAYHDSLTGLNNRMSMHEKINARLASIRNISAIDALIFIDVDNFKYINDSMGHAFGDKLLISISNRLKTYTDENVLLFRLGGDEFIVYTLNNQNKTSIRSFANDLLENMRMPFNIDGSLTNITISMGIATYPENASDIHELLRFADIAMYTAKKNNKNSFYFFNNMMNTEMIDRITIENLLKTSLINNEFILYYQPLVKADNNTVEGFEALIRWDSQELGMLPPCKFINIAEETGFIVELGEWILRTACTFITNFNKAKGTNYIINVNISALQLLADDFTDMILKIVRDTELDPNLLELEITETAIMESTDEIIKKLRMLRGYGIGIAIDDFGTGYSSLGRLITLPITTLKIDKSFIDNLSSENGYYKIAETVIELGHKLGLKIIAEGVETDSQLKYLSNNNCDIIQGYLFFRPMPPEEVYNLI